MFNPWSRREPSRRRRQKQTKAKSPIGTQKMSGGARRRQAHYPSLRSDTASNQPARPISLGRRSATGSSWPTFRAPVALRATTCAATFWPSAETPAQPYFMPDLWRYLLLQRKRERQESLRGYRAAVAQRLLFGNLAGLVRSRVGT
jgi:hypothetical protein